MQNLAIHVTKHKSPCIQNTECNTKYKTQNTYSRIQNTKMHITQGGEEERNMSDLTAAAEEECAQPAIIRPLS